MHDIETKREYPIHAHRDDQLFAAMGGSFVYSKSVRLIELSGCRRPRYWKKKDQRGWLQTFMH